jgi:phage terminase Nu1 subunit (DNA packaging protein)
VEAQTDFDNQRERLAAAQAEKVEMENAIRRRQLADVAAVQAIWADHILAARAKLLSLPSKLGPQLANGTDPAAIAGRIRAEIYAALDELADADTETGGGPFGGAPNSDPVLETAA